MNAEIRRHTRNCVVLYAFWFHSSRYSRTIDLLTEDVTHTLDTFSKTPFSIILRIITLAFPIYIYIIHGNLRIIANKLIYIYIYIYIYIEILCFISFRWSSTPSLLCLFDKTSLHLNRH